MKDLTGKTFGFLTYLHDVERGAGRRAAWRCVCGNTHISLISHVVAGKTTNCGCKKRARAIAMGRAKKKPLPRKTPENYAWTGMRQRCYNPNSPNYSRYGARGIIVCGRWLESYEAFYADMGPRPTPKHSVDRINVHGNYEPGNCRWALPVVQANNRERSVRIEYQGKTLTFREWSQETNIGFDCLRRRYWLGLRGDALFAPTKPRPRRH